MYPCSLKCFGTTRVILPSAQEPNQSLSSSLSSHATAACHKDGLLYLSLDWHVAVEAIPTSAKVPNPSFSFLISISCRRILPQGNQSARDPSCTPRQNQSFTTVNPVRGAVNHFEAAPARHKELHGKKSFPDNKLESDRQSEHKRADPVWEHPIKYIEGK